MRYMVTCTAIEAAILQPPGNSGTRQHSRQAERVAGKNVHRHQEPLSLLHEGKALEGIAGEGGVRPAEADGDEQPPPRVEQQSFAGEDEEETQHQAAS